MERSTTQRSLLLDTECAPGKGDAREWIALTLVVTALMAIRTPFMNTWQSIGDSVNYAWGAMVSNVAHAPGYIGYCLTVAAVNKIVNQVFLSMLIISLISTTLAIVLCHFLAKAVGLRWKAALLTAAIYGLGLNTLAVSLTCLPHIVEGMFVTAFGLFAVMAVRRRTLGPALMATAVYALAGAFRPSTTFLLTPAWLYMVFTSFRAAGVAREGGDAAQVAPRRGLLPHLLMNFALAAAIAAPWKIANEYYMRQAGFGGMTFDLQVMMPSYYEYASLSVTPERFPTERPTYHMPGFEFLSWADRKLLGTNMLPHKPSWPEPSFARASRLTLMQTTKLSVGSVVASPPFVMVLLAWIIGWVGPRRLALPRPRVTRLLMLWLVPALLFFMFGHLGALTYLQVIVPVMTVLACYALFRDDPTDPEGEVAPAGQSILPRDGRRRFVAALVLLVTAAGAVFFVVGKRSTSQSRIARGYNIVLSGMTGPTIRDQTNFLNRFSQGEEMANPYSVEKNNAALLRVFEAEGYNPMPVSLRTPRPGAPAPATRPVERIEP